VIKGLDSVDRDESGQGERRVLHSSHTRWAHDAHVPAHKPAICICDRRILIIIGAILLSSCANRVHASSSLANGDWNAMCEAKKALTPAPLRVIHVWAPRRATPNSTARMVRIQFLAGWGQGRQTSPCAHTSGSATGNEPHGEREETRTFAPAARTPYCRRRKVFLCSLRCTAAS
jgi:hypothetical protein